MHLQLILMDLLMPVCDGFKAASKIIDILRKEYTMRINPGGDPEINNTIEAMRPESIAAEMKVTIAAVTSCID